MTDTGNNDASLDDISVHTAHAENRRIANNGKPKEYIVNFIFRPNGANNNTVVAKTHYALLKSIVDIYPEVQVFDNFGATMTTFPTLKSYDAYHHHFKLQFVKANESKNHGAIYLVFHRILSPVPLSEICCHATIDALLTQVSTCMTLHHWTEDETRIANLGFFIGFDPTNILHKELEERIRSAITTATKHPSKKIPKFRCSYTSPYFRNAAIRTSTKAYDIQCRQQDAKDMIGLLQKAYASNPIFIFHKI